MDYIVCTGKYSDNHSNIGCKELNFPPEYLEARAFTRRWEGGYVNNPADPGGATNQGVTQRTYNSYRKKKGLPVRPVKDIELAEANEIYFDYWLAAKCQFCPYPLYIAMFDTSINFGSRRPVLFLQKALGLNADGIFGPKTKAGLEKCNPLETALKICEIRKQFRHDRVKKNPSQKVFLKGWLNRDNALIKEVSKTPVGVSKVPAEALVQATNDLELRLRKLIAANVAIQTELQAILEIVKNR